MIFSALPPPVPTVAVKNGPWTLMPKALVFIAVMFLAFIIVTVSPFISSYCNYGHPLYPKYTSDAKNFPVLNITDDFLDRNDDAASMGHFEAWMNAFVSSSLVKWHRNRQNNCREFVPHSATYGYGNVCFAGKSCGSPTKTWFKLDFCMGILFLIVFGGTCGLFVSVCIIAGTLALPTEMIGYLRYTPWAYCAIVFVFPILCRLNKRWMVKLLLSSFIIISCPKIAYPVIPFIVSIDASYSARRMLVERPPRVMLSSKWEFKKGDDRYFSGNLYLLRRQVPELSESEIVEDPLSSSFAESIIISQSKFLPFFGESFKVLPDSDITKFSLYRKLVANSDGCSKRISWINFVLKTLFVILPRNCWEVMYGMR